MGNNLNIIPWSDHSAYNHIVSIVNTSLNKYDEGKIIRILDVGFGSGKLLCQLLDYFNISRPALQFEVFGLDVFDAGVQDAGFMERTSNLLLNRHPEKDWHNKLFLISTKDKWPFENNSFDFILSNQVLEHIFNFDLFFNEIRRCLKIDGSSINLFPTREVLWEGHVHMPIVHKVRNEKLRSHIIFVLANLGFKKCYYFEMHRRGWKSIKEFATVFSNVLETDTNYIAINQLKNIARRNGLNISFTYTKDFYITKMLSLFGIKYSNYKNWGRMEGIICFFLKYISAITVNMIKDSSLD